MIVFVHLRVQKSNTLTGVHQLLLSDFAASLCLFQGSSEFLNFSHHETVPALYHSSLFLEVILGSDSIIKVQLCILVKKCWKIWKIFIECQNVGTVTIVCATTLGLTIP